jgi:hypothetical protein
MRPESPGCTSNKVIFQGVGLFSFAMNFWLNGLGTQSSALYSALKFSAILFWPGSIHLEDGVFLKGWLNRETASREKAVSLGLHGRALGDYSTTMR